MSLLEYRQKQSNKLKERLDVFIKKAIDLYGSVENINHTDTFPISNNKDVELINKMIDSNTFILLPYYDENNVMKGVYTLGLWYYWQLPELIINFEKDIEFNLFVNLVVSAIKNKLAECFNIDDKTNDIIELEDFVLEKITDEKYMKMTTLMWFYMYFSDTNVLYPIYQIDISNYDYLENKLFDNVLDKLFDNVGDISDTSDSDSDCLDI